MAKHFAYIIKLPLSWFVSHLVDPNAGQNFEITLSTSAIMDFHLYNVWTTQSANPALRTVCLWDPPPFTYSIILKTPGELPLYSSVCSVDV